MQEHMRKFAKKCTFFKIFHPFTASRQSRRCLEGISRVNRGSKNVRFLRLRPECEIFLTKITDGYRYYRNQHLARSRIPAECLHTQL